MCGTLITRMLYMRLIEMQRGRASPLKVDHACKRRKPKSINQPHLVLLPPSLLPPPHARPVVANLLASTRSDVRAPRSRAHKLVPAPASDVGASAPITRALPLSRGPAEHIQRRRWLAPRAQQPAHATQRARQALSARHDPNGVTQQLLVLLWERRRGIWAARARL